MYFVKVLKDIQNNTIFVSSSFLYVFVCVYVFVLYITIVSLIFINTHAKSNVAFNIASHHPIQHIFCNIL